MSSGGSEETAEMRAPRLKFNFRYVGRAIRALLFGPWFWAIAAIAWGASHPNVDTAAFIFAAGFSLWGAGRAVYRGGFRLIPILKALGYLAMGAFGMFLAVLSVTEFSRGRQLSAFRKVLLPKVQRGAAWTTSALDPPTRDAPRAALARHFRENGRTEHASVAAFARLTMDLMALGAPPELLAAANRDALDEIHHAELCFSLARSLDGQSEEPAAFAEARSARKLPRNRTLALAALAVDSLFEGALLEGVSARVLAKLARVCEEPGTRTILKQLAADEGRHAAHGFQVVDWCLAEGGRPVEEALLGALRFLPREMRVSVPEAARDGSWERFGVPGELLEQECFRLTRARVIRQLAERRSRVMMAHARDVVSSSAAA